MAPGRLVLGGALLLIGGALLLITNGIVTPGALTLPVIVVATGIFLLVRGFTSGGGEGTVFAGTFLTLSGGFLVLRVSALAETSMASIWPVFMTIGGIALIAYGLKRGRESAVTLVVPGVAIIMLSVLFLLFSLDVIQASLASLAATWWPVLIALAGGFVLLRGSNGTE